MYFIFDLETVPDVLLIRSMLEQEPLKPDEWIEGEMLPTLDDLSDQDCIDVATKRVGRGTSGFLPPMFHKIVSWVGLWVDAKGQPKQKEAWSGENENEGLITLFQELLTYKDFNLIHHNGRSFDLPVIEYRALRFNLQMPPRLSHREIKYRYSGNNVDLVDEFTNYGASSWPKLKHLGMLINIPFKQVSEGNLVYEQYLLGNFNIIENYCYEDVVATYIIWLHLEYTRSNIKEKEFENLKSRALNKLFDIQKTNK